MLLAAAGCAQVLAATCNGAPAFDEIKVTSGGTTESVAVHFASSYDGRKPLPLVLDLHPSGGNAAQQAAISSMQAAADEHGFVVAWPEGGVRLPQTPEGRYWNIPGVP